MLVGYVRAGSLDRNPGRQLEELTALQAAGGEGIYGQIVWKEPEATAVLDRVRAFHDQASSDEWD